MEETKFLLALLFSVIHTYDQNIAIPFVHSATHLFRLYVMHKFSTTGTLPTCAFTVFSVVRVCEV